jgi:transcriptional regulator with XRE-family HTH domain
VRTDGAREERWLTVRVREGDIGGLALFASELVAARTKRNMTQEALSEALNYSGSLVAMIETGRRAPSRDFALACDRYFDTSGTFARLQENSRSTPLPTWFKPWAEIEAAAAQLRLFEHSIIPGLLQTESYARAILAGEPNTTPEEIAERVTARTSRQAILNRDQPPVVLAVIDESALRRQVGSAKTMCEQVTHLADMAGRAGVTIQVVPLSVGAHCGLAGAFAIAAEADGSPRAAYIDGITEGYIGETPPVLAEVCAAFDALRSEALPRGASLDLIRRTADDFDRPD